MKRGYFVNTGDMHYNFLKYLELVLLEKPHVYNVRIAAAIVHKRDLLSIGFNSTKTHPLQARHADHPDRVHMHAEVNAICGSFKSKQDLDGCTIYICRLKYADSDKSSVIWGNVKPCDSCFKLIKDYNFKQIIYTLDGVDRYCVQRM